MTTDVAGILAAAPYSEAEEATYGVASMCNDATELRDLLGALGLPAVKRRWTVPRAQRRIIGCGRGGFTSGVISHYLPRRARHLIPDTIAALLVDELIEQDPLELGGYRLTAAGKHLAIEVRGDRMLAADGSLVDHTRGDMVVRWMT